VANGYFIGQPNFLTINDLLTYKFKIWCQREVFQLVFDGSLESKAKDQTSSREISTEMTYLKIILNIWE